MKSNKTVDLLYKIFNKSLNLVPKMSVSEWADRFRMLPSSSAEPGRWRTSRAPYQKEIMDAFTEKGVRKVVVKSASQIGKSDIMNNIIGRFAHLDPCPIMMIQPTIIDGEDYSKSRIAPMISATPVLKNIFKDAKVRDSGNTIMTKYFPGGRLVITGANSPSSLASKPISKLFCDEVDRFPESAGTEGDPVDLASKRTTTYWNRIIGLFSTPTIKGLSRIDDEYMTGTQAEWQHQCPNCKEWHLITHRNMKVDYEESENKKKQKHIIVKSVVWVCPDCGFSFSEQKIKQAKQKYVIQNPQALKSEVRSFFVNGFASPWISWNEIMEEWLKAKGDPEREKVVYNTRFGESYEQVGAFENGDMFLKRREKYEAELPDGVLALTATVDTQDNRLEYEITGWGIGEEQWSIKKGIILGVPDTSRVWELLDQVLDRTYYFKNGKALTILRTFIDSGGHYTNEVYKYCYKSRKKQRIAIKGSSIPGVPLVYRISKIEKYGIPLVQLGVDSGKQYIMDRLTIEEKGKKYIHFPLNEIDDGNIDSFFLDRGYDEVYFKGLISEHLVQKTRNGATVFVWEKISKDARNEPLDLKVYNLACMQSLNLNFEALYEAFNSNSLTKLVGKPNKKEKKKVNYGAVNSGGVMDFVE